MSWKVKGWSISYRDNMIKLSKKFSDSLSVSAGVSYSIGAVIKFSAGCGLSGKFGRHYPITWSVYGDREDIRLRASGKHFSVSYSKGKVRGNVKAFGFQAAISFSKGVFTVKSISTGKSFDLEGATLSVSARYDRNGLGVSTYFTVEF